MRETERRGREGTNMDYSTGFLSEQVREAINPELFSSLLLPPSALYVILLSSGDLIMED